MSVDVSSRARRSAQAAETEEVWLELITIDHPSLSAPLRLTSNTQPINSAGPGLTSDLTANANAGALIGDPAYITDPPQGRAALRLASSLDQYVQVGDLFDFPGNSPFSYACRFRASVLKSDSPYLISKEAASAGQNLLIRKATGALCFERFVGGAYVEADGGEVRSGEWQHAAGVYDGAQLLLYVDGALVGSTPDTRTQVDTGAALLFGRSATLAAQTEFDGDLSQVSIWDKAIGLGEVQALIAQPPVGNEAGLVGYWPLDDPPYEPYPFRLTLPGEEEDRPPVAKLRIDNVDRRILETIRSLPRDEPPSVIVEVALAADPRVVDWSFGGLLIESVRGDALVVEADLGIKTFIREAVPHDTFNAQGFPGLFR